MSDAYRCGYVALVGRPNAVKSTLLNQILGGKLAITSAKPQTTRNRIAGIHTDERMQMILVDTPGIHSGWTELNKAMVDRAMAALEEVDLVCWLVDMTDLAARIEKGRPVLGPEEEVVAKAVEGAHKPVIFLANKIDVIPHPLVLPVFAAVSERLDPAACIPVSALTGDGVPAVMQELYSLLPKGDKLFPEDE